MSSKLKQYFPLIRSREEILTEIEANERMNDLFICWPHAIREEFLDFCSGVRGSKMMYDFMSKQILDPDAHRSRVNDFLSLLLGQKVKVLETLNGEGGRIAESFVIMDIVVELEDGSIVNLEIQKIGYLFPGERSACYSADLLMRQYRRVKEKYERMKKKTRNCYKDIKDVYTIVLFEDSPEGLSVQGDQYIHRFEQHSDTGAEMNLLQKYLFVSLDKFKKIKHNNDSKMIHINNRLEAWLAFLCLDEPEDIVAVIEQYPDFQEMYRQVYEICRNMEDVMGFFSEELYEMDRNTAEYMVDEMKKEKERLQKDLDELQEDKDKLQEDKDKLQEDKDKLQENNDKLRKELEELKRAYSELCSKVEK
mgnify:FL=1